MKHTYRWILILALLLVALAGCSTNADTKTGATTATADAQLTDEMSLIIGTLKLESTDQAVTAAQATELLPLWKGYVALSESESASQIEVDAVVSQIAETMSDEQMATIKALELSTGSAFELVNELGLTTATDDAGGERTTGTGPGGGMGGGSGVPGSGPGSGDVTSLSAEQIAELQAERQASGGNQGGAMLAAEIIKLLQTRAS